MRVAQTRDQTNREGIFFDQFFEWRSNGQTDAAASSAGVDNGAAAAGFHAD
jgi:hypothetical protein